MGQPGRHSFGTVLSSTQLNATADVPGNFAYTPAAGTILAPGSSQLLTVVFTPTSSYYFTRSATARINVLPAAVQLSITRTLTRNGDGSIRLAVTLSNTGGSTAQNMCRSRPPKSARPQARRCRSGSATSLPAVRPAVR